MNAYAHGRLTALRKLGFFLEGLDPEDLPEFLAKKRRAQIQKTLGLTATTGFPAGGRAEIADALQE